MTMRRLAKHATALTWRNLVKIKHSPAQLLDVTIQPIIFVLLFVFIFGGAISRNWHAYLQFATPGLLVQTFVFSSAGIGFALNGDIRRGIFDRFRSLPIARSAPLLGALFGDAVRIIIAALVLLIFCVALGFRFHGGALAGLASFLLPLCFAWSFCWLSMLMGLVIKNVQTLQGLSVAIMFPITFGSNIFVPTNTMPGWLQAWVKISPITHLVNSVRALMLGGAVATQVIDTVIWMAILIVAFAPLALYVYRQQE